MEEGEQLLHGCSITANSSSTRTETLLTPDCIKQLRTRGQSSHPTRTTAQTRNSSTRPYISNGADTRFKRSDLAWAMELQVTKVLFQDFAFLRLTTLPRFECFGSGAVVLIAWASSLAGAHPRFSQPHSRLVVIYIASVLNGTRSPPGRLPNSETQDQLTFSSVDTFPSIHGRGLAVGTVKTRSGIPSATRLSRAAVGPRLARRRYLLEVEMTSTIMFA
jgi:hypothetical protein